MGRHLPSSITQGELFGAHGVLTAPAEVQVSAPLGVAGLPDHTVGSPVNQRCLAEYPGTLQIRGAAFEQDICWSRRPLDKDSVGRAGISNPSVRGPLLISNL